MIINFGSINIDMVFQIDTMPTPGETILCPGYEVFPGGKGANQAIAAARAGADVTMVGAVGQGEFGSIAMKSLSDSNVHIDAVRILDDVPTGCATICVDSKGENMITVASGANLHISADNMPAELATEDNTLLLQMETPAGENWKLIERWPGRVIVNLAPANPIPEEALRKISLLIMNEGEAEALANHLNCSPSDLPQYLQDHYGTDSIITMGAKGSIAYTSHGSWHVPALVIEAIDTTAAGDAFVGVLAAQIDDGYTIEEALQFAAVASGLACTKVGAQPSLPIRPEIEANLSRLDPLRQVA
ncbi:MAG: ribokinase [Alphaproteobacteria bacterium]